MPSVSTLKGSWMHLNTLAMVTRVFKTFCQNVQSIEGKLDVLVVSNVHRAYREHGRLRANRISHIER